MNPHQDFQHTIDQSLAGGISPKQQQALRQHLATCPACQQYLDQSNRVLSGLSGFSFPVNPDLNAKVLASLRQRALELQPAQPIRRPWASWVVISLAAALTLAGSLLDLRFGGFIASVLNLQGAQVQHNLLAFWIEPSLFTLLLFPLLPLLARRHERSL
jgi:anti-sigma factor RsiW